MPEHNHPNGICDCGLPWQGYADWVDPPPHLTDEQYQLLIERCRAKYPHIRQITLTTRNPDAKA